MFPAFYNIAVSFLFHLSAFVGKFSRPLRKLLLERGSGHVVRSGNYKYWFHCASYGEFEMALPLIEGVLASCQEEDLIITFFSPSGYSQARKHANLKEQVMYLPYDTRKQVADFYSRYSIEKAVFIRYDLWYNFINSGLKKGIDFYLINARYSRGHFILGFGGIPYRKLLNSFEGLFASDHKTVELSFKKLPKMQFTGDTRYDRVKRIQDSAQEFDSIAKFKDDKPLLVLGSSYFYEEDLLEKILPEIQDLKVIIAPHNVSEERILELESKFSAYQPKLWSKGNADKYSHLLIVDTIGVLSALYRYSDVALVGGGFTGALHNIIEPCVWGNVICFGPLTEKYPEAQSCKEAGFAFDVKNGEELLQLVSRLLEAQEEIQRLKGEARMFVEERLGATNKILAYLNN